MLILNDVKNKQSTDGNLKQNVSNFAVQVGKGEDERVYIQVGKYRNWFLPEVLCCTVFYSLQWSIEFLCPKYSLFSAPKIRVEICTRRTMYCRIVLFWERDVVAPWQPSCLQSWSLSREEPDRIRQFHSAQNIHTNLKRCAANISNKTIIKFDFLQQLQRWFSLRSWAFFGCWRPYSFLSATKPNI